MSTIVVKETSGKFDIKVLGYGKDAERNEIQKITIPVRILKESDIAQQRETLARCEAGEMEARKNFNLSARAVKSLESGKTQPLPRVVKGR
jgi:hypothetical protein